MNKVFTFLMLIAISFTSCTENYSNGERIGLVTQFSQTGVKWKSWEGHLNLTQTGMNSSSSTPFDFSIDNDNEDTSVIHKIDSAATYGWKVKLTYHETCGKNWFNNRGHTDHFITAVQILDRDVIGNIFGNTKSNVKTSIDSMGQRINRVEGGRVDTIYVVIVPKPKS